jgi:chemotaxis protein MotB
VAKILGGTVDEKGNGNAMMKGPGGAQRSPKEAQPDNIVELLPSLQRLNKQLEEEIQEHKVELRLEPRGLVVSLRESAFFPSGTDRLAPDSGPILQKIAEVIATLPNAIQLEGHTDSIPIHTSRFRSNWELSCARGIALLDAMTEDFGLDRERFSVVGRADTVPVASNDTPEGRSRNRRVDLIIVASLKVQSSSTAKK